jgi:hypothetical protein
MAIANFVVLVSIIGAAVMVGAIWEWFADWRLIRATRRRLASAKFRKSRRAA